MPDATDAESVSYFEIYTDHHGLVVEVYLTKEDFELARNTRIQLSSTPLSTEAPPRVYVRQTVAPYRPRLRPRT